MTLARPGRTLRIALAAALVALSFAVLPGHASDVAANCGADPSGFSECDFYITDTNQDLELAGSDTTTPTVLTSTPVTLTQTATNYLYPDNGNGMSQVSLNTHGGPIDSYSPHAGGDLSVFINGNVITWSEQNGSLFDAGETFTVSSTETADGDGELGLGAGWQSSYGYGDSYGPPVTLSQSTAPVAAFDVAPNGKVPGQYSFVSESTDPQGEALDQHWTLGDGATALGPAVTHTYKTPGTYAVTLTVTNTDGDSTSVTHSVVVAAPKLSASLAFVDAAGTVLRMVSPQIGDTIHVRLTLSASDAGVGDVKNIGFVGAPFTLTPDTLTTVSGPVPAIPTAASLAPGTSTSYVYALKVTAAGVVRMTSTPTGKDVTGAAVATQPAQLSFGISALLVSVSLNPPKFTEAQTASGTTPTDVTATVTIKNTSPDPITDINLQSISASPTSTGQLLSVAYVSGVKPDTTAGYLLTGTLAPGASEPPQQTVFAVASDGTIAFQSLVTGASPSGGTLRGLGTAKLSVKPTYYLEFTSRVQTPARGLLPAGTPIVISGTVRNVTSSDTLDVGPLFAKVAGNAGLQGLAYNGVGVDPKALTTPGALTLDPGDIKSFTLKVLTAYSDPTGAGGVLPSGGTSADISFTPWATVTQPDGTSFTTDPDGSQVLTTPADLTHHIPINDSIPIPVTSRAVVAGGLLVGATEGVWNAASGLVTGLISLPSVAASGLLAVTDYQATVWNSFTEAQKQQFANDTAAAVVPVLEANVGLAAEGSAKLFNEASAFTYQYFTTLDNDWQVGNYAQTVEAYTSLTSNALAQVAIPVGLGKLASSSEAVATVEQAQAALQAKIASLTSTIDSAKTMEQVAPLLTTIASGTELNPAEVAQLYGIAPAELQQLQDLATQFRYLLTVRSRAGSSLSWIEKFQALVKPEAIKLKSVSELDTKLGYSTKYEGSLVLKEPVPLLELRQHGGQISDLVQAYVEKQGFSPGTVDYDNAISRVALRISEWNKYAETYAQWSKQGWVDVSFNWKGNAMADPELAGRGKYVGFRLQPTGEPEEYVVQMYNGRAGKYVPVTGDIDPIAFTHLDGSPLTSTEHAQLIDAMRTNPLLQAQHGESATYVNGGVDFIDSQFKPNEAALQIAPGGEDPRVVRFNTRQSVWKSPTDYHLVWDDGTDYAGSSPASEDAPLNIDYGTLSAGETAPPPEAATALPGAGVPNVGRCAMTYGASGAALPLIMGASGTLQQVTSSGDIVSSYENICFTTGPIVNVTIRPTTTVASAVSPGTSEIPIQTGPGVAGVNGSSGFDVGQQVVVGAGSSDAESGVIAAFGSIILKRPLVHAHPAGDVIVVTSSAASVGATPTSSAGSLPFTGFDAGGVLLGAFGLLVGGGALRTFGRRRSPRDTGLDESGQRLDLED